MRITINDDFDLEKIEKSGQCFRWERVGEQAYRIPHKSACLRIEAVGESAYELNCSEADFEAVWRDYFDLGENYAAIREGIDPDDEFLTRAAVQCRGIRILRQDPWEMLVTFIISQNRAIPLIRSSVELLCEIAGTPVTDSAGSPYRAFPTPEAILRLTDNDLAACKLGYRVPYVRSAAESAISGTFDPEGLAGLSAEDTIAELTKLYGVGVKVASCAALFGLHKTDAFPVDTWIRKVLASEYPNGYPFERYRPYNGVLQQYMFACYRELYGK